MNKKLKLLIGFHSYLPFYSEQNEERSTLIEGQLNSINSLLEYLSSTNKIKVNFHFTENLLKLLDKKFVDFSSRFSKLLENNNIELISGGLNEPLFPLIPKEDRQIQVKVMNRFINHLYGYNPIGVWLPGFAWDSSLAEDLSKSRISYTFLPKDYFVHAGIDESEVSGFHITEDDGKKLDIFPITFDLNEMVDVISPQEAIKKLETILKESKDGMASIFYKRLIANESKVKWLKEFFKVLESKEDSIETMLFNEFHSTNKPTGRIYLPSIQSLEYKHSTRYWKYFLVKYSEANLLHKKMLRVSKKINAAKEGKSRFKVIKEMINQAHDLLLKGQNNSTFWDNSFGGIYSPEERHLTYSNLIKAENLIDSASKKGANWIQLTEIDYDSDGHDEIIIESLKHNIYISPELSGGILEHDFRENNLNIVNTMSRRKEEYHPEDKELIYDSYPKLSLMDHFISNDISIKECINNKLPLLTTKEIHSYEPDKLKAKEQTSRAVLYTNVTLDKLPEKPEIKVEKTIGTRVGETVLNVNYTLTNSSQTNVDFTFAVEFNYSLPGKNSEDTFTYLNGHCNEKTKCPYLYDCETIESVNQVSIFNKPKEVDINLTWNNNAQVFKFPIKTLSYSNQELKEVEQCTTIMPTWKVSLPPGESTQISITQEINNISNLETNNTNSEASKTQQISIEN